MIILTIWGKEQFKNMQHINNEDVVLLVWQL